MEPSGLYFIENISPTWPVNSMVGASKDEVRATFYNEMSNRVRIHLKEARTSFTTLNKFILQQH